MEREIKFRAWDKEGDNNYTPVHEIGMLYPDDFEKMYGYKMNPTHKSNRYIFMQYTGLKDKNGVEIYEGDVVKSVFYNHAQKSTYIIQTVCFDKGTFIIKSDDVELESSRRNVPIFWADEIEVIGNIYSTPSLITNKTQ